MKRQNHHLASNSLYRPAVPPSPFLSVPWSKGNDMTVVGLLLLIGHFVGSVKPVLFRMPCRAPVPFSLLVCPLSYLPPHPGSFVQHINVQKHAQRCKKPVTLTHIRKQRGGMPYTLSLFLHSLPFQWIYCQARCPSRIQWCEMEGGHCLLLVGVRIEGGHFSLTNTWYHFINPRLS